MPKQKTRKSIARRFRITKTGKVLRRRSFSRHLMVKKSSKRRRSLRRVVETNKTYAKKIRKRMGK